MQAIQNLLRTTLAKSLDSLSPLDRLAAAWPVAAGHAISERSIVTGWESSTVIVTVPDAAWQHQLRSSAPQLEAELARISRVPLTAILFLSPLEVARRESNRHT